MVEKTYYLIELVILEQKEKIMDLILNEYQIEDNV